MNLEKSNPLPNTHAHAYTPVCNTLLYETD